MEEQSIEFIYPTCKDLRSVVVTNSREAAARNIERGYTLFTVPQLFGKEYGQIVLFREHGAKIESDGIGVLETYESVARKYYSSGGTFSIQLKV